MNGLAETPIDDSQKDGSGGWEIYNEDHKQNDGLLRPSTMG